MTFLVNAALLNGNFSVLPNRHEIMTPLNPEGDTVDVVFKVVLIGPTNKHKPTKGPSFICYKLFLFIIYFQ